MTSSKSAFVDDLGDEGMNAQIKTAIQTYADDLIALYGPTAAATNGQSDKWAVGVGQILMGTAVNEKLGNSTTKVLGKINLKGKIRKRTIATASAITDNGKPFYATDENTYTLAVPSIKAVPIGIVVQWITGTTCLVYEFPQHTLRANDMAGQGLEDLHLGSFPCTAFANGNMVVDLPLRYHAQIEQLWSAIRLAPAGASGTATIKAQIKAVGGSYVDVGAPTTFVAAATGDALGAVKTSAAVTTANIFHDGDLLQLVASAVTAMSAGHVDIYAKVRRRFGV
jgi:hypothetical protein